MAVFNDKSTKDFRRAQRNNMSRGEQVLWNGLRKNNVGAKFRRQESVLQYVVDFYCPELGLAIEVDGIQHQHNQAYDKNRDLKLSEIGVRVLRFKDSDVISNSEKVLDEIRGIVNQMRANGISYRRASTQFKKPPPDPRLEKAGESDPQKF